MLLKPWRQIRDLKVDETSFESALSVFLQNADEWDKRIVDNIQYYHDCWDAAQARRDAYRRGKRVPIFDYEQQTTLNAVDDERDDDMGQDSGEESDEQPFWIPTTVTEELIEKERRKLQTERDQEFAEKAMAIAKSCKLFTEETECDEPQTRRLILIATQACEEDLAVISRWERTLHAMTRKQALEQGVVDLSALRDRKSNGTSVMPAMQVIDADGNTERSQVRMTGRLEETTEEASTVHRKKLAMLNMEQRRAHDIIEKRTITGTKDAITSI